MFACFAIIVGPLFQKKVVYLSCRSTIDSCGSSCTVCLGRGMRRRPTGQLCLLLSSVAGGDLGFHQESNVYHQGLYERVGGTAISDAGVQIPGGGIGGEACSWSLADQGCRCLLKNGKITDAQASSLEEALGHIPGRCALLLCK